MIIAAAALIVGGSLAAGAVVDATAAADARGTAQASIDPTLALVLRPAIRAALEDAGAGLDATYAPQLSFVTPSTDVIAILHTGTLRGELPVSPRLVLRSGAAGTIGDLDPGTAQRTLLPYGGLLAGALALPYASGAVDAGARWRALRNVELDVAAGGTVTGSPVPDDPAAIPTTLTGDAGLSGTFVASRANAWLADLRLRAGERRNDPSARDDRLAFAGASASAGFRQRVGRGVSLDVTGGAFAVGVQGGETPGFRFLPEGALRAAVAVDLAGASALEALVEASLSAATDPLGALLEQRVIGAAGLAWRATREVSARGRLFSFVPLTAYAGTTIVTASAGVDVGAAYAVSPDVSFEAGLIGTMRLVEDGGGRGTGLQGDVTALVGVSATETLFHTGSRPRGSDPRPGRAVGERRIGDPPRPTEIEPPPPLETLDEPEPPALLPELVPPPVEPPGRVDAPLVHPDPRRGRDEDRERRRREEEEQKRRKGKKGDAAREEEADQDADGDDAKTERANDADGRRTTPSRRP